MEVSIAILGWGSLLWDKSPQFDEHHGCWKCDGPELPIEFSRVSKTRSGALTLVIDPLSGAKCRVAYTKSKRRDPEDAICDLRCREGTVRRNIGSCFMDGSRSQSNDATSLCAIRTWAAKKAFDVVVWTDLQPDFAEKVGRPFSVPNAIAYISTLHTAGRSRAIEYVRLAPAFVKTPLREALQAQPWFKS